MSLAAGARLGPYEIIAPIGAGGMGEVYRARDTRLGRDVAIKILPEVFARDPERFARFEREARTLALLNHPHIAQVFGLESSGLTSALVMELVEGEDLSQRIERGPIALDEALTIARQIAAALEAAHDAGIVHRDLKPANIRVRPDGSVKVLDFGLAKPFDAVAAAAPAGATITTPAMTMHGMILGTAAYMAPEQAKGKAVDKRADIWAFGVVLHEMLTGARTFPGEDATEVIASVIKDQPDIAKAPPQVRRLLRRCLEKDPRLRLRDIGDAGDLLHDDPAPAAARRSLVPWIVAAGCALAAVALATLQFREMPGAAAPALVTFQLPIADEAGAFIPILSPDGTRLAYSAGNAVWVRDLDSLDAKPVPDADGIIAQPFWSDDSRFLAFAAKGELKKADGSGGPSQLICALPGILAGGFTTRDRIVFSSVPGGLSEVRTGGGTPSKLAGLEKLQTMIGGGPVLLPDGRHFVFAVVPPASTAAADGNHGIYAAALDQADPAKLLLPDVSAVAYVPAASSGSGYLVFSRGGALLAQPFRPATLELAGDPLPIVERAQRFSASSSGALVYRAGDAGRKLTWFDRQGNATATVGGPGAYIELAIAPDGSRAAVVHVERSPSTWIHDFARETTTRLPFSNSSVKPVWSPDGRIVFASGDGTKFDLFRSQGDGAGERELLFDAPGFKAPRDTSRDGRWLMFERNDPRTREDLWLLPLEGRHTPEPFLVTDFAETDGMFSPDGRHVAYVSNETGTFEVYVRGFPASAAGKWRVSTGGGYQPRWRRDGRELFFITGDGRLMHLEVTPGAGFTHGAPSTLFQTSMFGGGATTSNHYWDVMPDGQRFLINTMDRAAKSAALTVVLNWQGGLKK